MNTPTTFQWQSVSHIVFALTILYICSSISPLRIIQNVAYGWIFFIYLYIFISPVHKIVQENHSLWTNKECCTDIEWFEFKNGHLIFIGLTKLRVYTVAVCGTWQASLAHFFFPIILFISLSFPLNYSSIPLPLSFSRVHPDTFCCLSSLPLFIALQLALHLLPTLIAYIYIYPSRSLSVSLSLYIYIQLKSWISYYIVVWYTMHYNEFLAKGVYWWLYWWMTPQSYKLSETRNEEV